VLYIVDLYLDLMSLIIGCLVFRKSWPFAYKCLFFLNVLRVFASFFAHFWQACTHSSNHWIFNLFLPLQCVGFLLVFYSACTYPSVRRISKWLLAAFPLVTAISWLRGAPFEIINMWATVGFDFLLLISVCLTFVDLLLEMDNMHFIRQPMFWLASGLFFYSVESIIGSISWEYSKKMILFGLYTFIAFSGDYLLDAGIIGCFICIYLERRVLKKPRDLAAPGLGHRE